jgi:23S rRNA pseudoU1915 N3-methylase RlmH
VRIIVVAVGRLRPPFEDDVAHYEKLLGRYARLELIEVREDEQVGKRIPERALQRAGRRMTQLHLPGFSRPDARADSISAS